MERSTRLAASLRYSLYATTALVFASGALWLGARYLPASRSLPGGFAAACMRVHGGAAMALLVLIGSAVSLHVPDAWRERKNLASGISLAGALIAITATGYCLYYLGGESARTISSLGHWILGLALPLVLGWHLLLLGRRLPPSRPTSPSDVAAAPDKNPGNATAASGERR